MIFNQYLKNWLKRVFTLVVSIIFLTSFVAEENRSTINDQQLASQVMLLTLECLNQGDSLVPEKRKAINSLLKSVRKEYKTDSILTYLSNILYLSHIQFVEKNTKKAYKISEKLISRYAKYYTSSFGTTIHDNTPTFDWVHERNGVQLGKIKFSLTASSDSLTTSKRSFISGVLKEIPMSLQDDIYQTYVNSYINVGATNYDLLFFILRCIKFDRCDLVKDLITILFSRDNNSNRKNILKIGLALYARSYERMDLVNYLCEEHTEAIIEFDTVSFQNSWSFCLSLYGNHISYREVFIPIILHIFGRDSNEFRWAHSRDNNILDFLHKEEEYNDWDNRIISAKNLNDSVALSTNILKSMSNEENKYRYDDMLRIGEQWGEYIISSHLVEYWNGMGLAYRYLGLYNQAAECFIKALDVIDSGVTQLSVFFMPKSKEGVLRNLAYTYSSQGEYDLAEKIISTKMPKWEITQKGINLFGEDILHCDDLGRIVALRDPQKAMEYFEMADSLLLERGSLAMTWSNVINHYISWSSIVTNKGTKRKYINRAEQILNVHLSSNLLNDPIAAGSIYKSLGRFYYSIFDYKTAFKYYRKTRQAFFPLKQEDRRKTEFILWDCLNRIAMRETDGIQTILESQLAMQDSLLGLNHYDCHQTVKGLLKLAIAENNQELARRYYPRFKSMEGVFGRELSNYGNQLIESSVLALLGHQKEAYEVADLVDLAECEPSVGLQTLEVKQSLTKNFPIRIQTSELQNINYSAKILSARLFTEVSGQDRVEWSRQLGSLRSGFIVNARTPEQIENALDFSLFTKGLLFRTNRHIASLISKTRQGQASLRELSEINDSINHYISLGDTIKSSGFRRRHEDVERDMINHFLTPNVMLTGLQIGKKDAIKNIGKDGLGIDFVKYSQNDSVYYGAFVFAENLPTNFIPLFTENKLVTLITDDSGRRTYEAFDGKHNSGTLYELIWGKLLQFFDGKSDVYFCGDGEIAQLGIEYLTDSKGNKISDSVKLHRVFHLADVTGDVAGGKDIVCMGVANHDFPVSHNGDDVDRGLWCNLNCDKEINDIRNTFKKKKWQKSFLIDDEVTEPFVQTLDKNSLSILHISTHGFYYNQDKLRSYARSTNSPDHYLAIRSLQSGKTSLSGLVLRKGNEYRKLPTLPMGYDDIWTSDEIEGLNFPKLQLTVLSACQTGLGQTDSEGVWGLQRAFRIAGTHKLVCALDYVSDKRTREFMSVFYKNLSKGISIYDSFQVARNHLFKHHRDDPRMWSAFVLIE